MINVDNIVAFLSLSLDLMRSVRANGSLSEKIEIRNALHVFEISGSTLRHIEKIAGAKTDQERQYEIGRLAIRQRDTRENVISARAVLRRFAEKSDISLAGRKLVTAGITLKLTFREQLAGVLHKPEDKKKIEYLAKVANELNSALVEIDNQIGGITLEQAKNG